MELMGVIAGLSAIQSREVKVKIFSDSVYVLRGASQWMHAWKKRGWKTASGSDVLNRELWEDLDKILRSWKGPLEWHYVRGHTGIPANERCDEIAVLASQQEDPDLYSGVYSNYPVDLRQLPADTNLPPMKAPGTKSLPLAYLSNVGGMVVRHATWSRCEARVKGRSGAKFKKVMSADEEATLLDTWGVSAEEVQDE